MDRSKQGMHKWTMQSLHVKTCLLLLDFLVSLPHFHQCNAHNASELLRWGVWRSLSCAPNTTLVISLTFNRSKVSLLTLLHLAFIATVFTDTLAGVVRSEITYHYPQIWLWFSLLASMKLRLFGPYLSGLIHPKATHFWNSSWDHTFFYVVYICAHFQIFHISID